MKAAMKAAMEKMATLAKDLPDEFKVKQQLFKLD